MSLFRAVGLTVILLFSIVVAEMAFVNPATQTAAAIQPPKDDIAGFMKIKLAAINAAMESAANDDFDEVQKAAGELYLLSKQASWQRQSDATYLQDTADFVAAAEFMMRMAESQDPQGVAASYGAVSASCLACHRHVRAPKIAKQDFNSVHSLAALIDWSSG